MQHALDAGFRRFDTASNYANEPLIGQTLWRAVSARGLERKDIVLGTKLDPVELRCVLNENDQCGQGHFGAESTLARFEAQLGALQVDYIDLYSLHAAGTDSQAMEASWQVLQQQQRAGRIRLLGVSNFDAAALVVLQ